MDILDGLFVASIIGTSANSPSIVIRRISPLDPGKNVLYQHRHTDTRTHGHTETYTHIHI